MQLRNSYHNVSTKFFPVRIPFFRNIIHVSKKLISVQFSQNIYKYLQPLGFLSPMQKVGYGNKAWWKQVRYQ